ncbi:unnamed protein product [Euphydryas editha]|uniref:Aspartate/ornithine carbamoyltransferase Asp/Orn-binding domain-containing protein n=1 Tax=Euphydryas editha TaxID=104508 RepID=A0AAU9UDQ4_EUPED|nr:unnamed protein product [Euphydryas editha]
MEEFGSLRDLNFAYCGSPHPVLNSYLLLCPMLGANIRFKCCCKKCPVSPLLFKASEDMTARTNTGLKECLSKDQVLKEASVVIAGPADAKKIHEFKLRVSDIESNTKSKWIFFHTGPRGKEVEDNLFLHQNSRTFGAFENFHYISAALLAYVIKDHKF